MGSKLSMYDKEVVSVSGGQVGDGQDDDCGHQEDEEDHSYVIGDRNINIYMVQSYDEQEIHLIPGQ